MSLYVFFYKVRKLGFYSAVCVSGTLSSTAAGPWVCVLASSWTISSTASRMTLNLVFQDSAEAVGVVQDSVKHWWFLPVMTHYSQLRQRRERSCHHVTCCSLKHRMWTWEFKAGKHKKNVSLRGFLFSQIIRISTNCRVGAVWVCIVSFGICHQRDLFPQGLPVFSAGRWPPHNFAKFLPLYILCERSGGCLKGYLLFTLFPEASPPIFPNPRTLFCFYSVWSFPWISFFSSFWNLSDLMFFAMHKDVL